MTAPELAAFLASRPAGAICVDDDDGRLLALPARVLDAEDGVLRVEVPGGEGAAALSAERQCCVVADVFESYEAIRGVIVQGPAMCTDSSTAQPVVTLKATRTTSFSFSDRSTG
jgi:hypothetical protein